MKKLTNAELTKANSKLRLENANLSQFLNEAETLVEVTANSTRRAMLELSAVNTARESLGNLNRQLVDQLTEKQLRIEYLEAQVNDLSARPVNL